MLTKQVAILFSPHVDQMILWYVILAGKDGVMFQLTWSGIN